LGSNDPTTRGAEPVRTINLKNGVKAYRQPVTRSNGTASTNDTLFYVFNFNDDQGFAVVSASRQTDGLIAVTESGYYDPSVPTGNPGFDTYMQMAKAYVAFKDRTPVEDEKVGGGTRYGPDQPMYMPEYDTVYYQKVDPMITVRWGQQGRTGQYCPNGWAGCGPVAAAQIMSYFKYPPYIFLTYSDCGVDYTPLYWIPICNHQTTNVSYNRDEYDIEIGRLCRQLGELAGSNYDSNGTSTFITNMRNTIQSLGYTVGSITDYALSSYDGGYPLATALGNNKLIYMRGENSNNIGHAWVIDGCYYVKCNYNLMCSYDGVNWFLDHTMYTYRTCHNHINWGWDGRQNGYFESNVLMHIILFN
ncbi:MAG: C10 family peptidase, partial [Prevotella sp.]|nr:C10 family peptidase [Prevotella sp.]